MPKGVYKHKPLSEKAKKKLSIFWKGKKKGPCKESHKKNLSSSLKGRKVWNENSSVRKGEYKYITRNKIKKIESHWAWFDNYGVFPKKGKIVHHKNFDVTDNRICNLQIMTRSEHIKLHNELTKGEKRGSIHYEEFK